MEDYGVGSRDGPLHTQQGQGGCRGDLEGADASTGRGDGRSQVRGGRDQQSNSRHLRQAEKLIQAEGQADNVVHQGLHQPHRKGEKEHHQQASGAFEDGYCFEFVGGLCFTDVTVEFGDGDSTYTMRNLGGGGVLAATFISWDDINDDSLINNAEPFIEMDVIHNFTVKWDIDKFNPRGKWFDVQNVATHEIGHVFGLGHPGNAHEADKIQTMFASAPSKETSKRDLEAGDISGIQSDFLGYQ